MIYGSVCSGIEAATVAWHPLGWKAAFYAEIDKFPSAVLAHHYPNVPNLGDFTTIRPDQHEPIDLLVGGTPCQSFSIAGLRGGLADDRGNLALEFLRLAQRARPRWVVWENVPGVFSSESHVAPHPCPPPPPVDMGCDGAEVETQDEYSAEELHAFNTFLAGLSELGYGVAYAVRDAQFVRVDGLESAVPQRRRRVFVVGYLGDWRRAAAVLFERASLLGDSAPGRQAGQGIAPTISARTEGGGGLGTDFDCDGGLISHTLLGKENDSPDTTLQTYVPEIMAQALTRKIAKGSSGPSGPSGPSGDEHHHLVAHALRADGFDASEDGTGRGTPLVAVPFDTTQITSKGNYSQPQPGDPCHALAAGAHPPAIAFDCKASGRNGFGTGEISPTLRAMSHSDSHQNAGGQVAVAFQSGIEPKASEGVAFTLTTPSRSGGGQPQAVAFNNTGQGWWNDADVASGLRDMSAGSGSKEATVVAFNWQGGGTQTTLGYDPEAGVAGSLHVGQTPAIAIQERAVSENAAAGPDGAGVRDDGAAYTLEARTVPQAVAFDMRGREGGAQFEGPHDTANIRASSGGSSRSSVAQTWAVRRLIPRECERLQGFKDDYTLIPWRNGLAPDGPRYKALGNSMAVNVMRWIGRRIEMVEAMDLSLMEAAE